MIASPVNDLLNKSLKKFVLLGKHPHQDFRQSVDKKGGISDSQSVCLMDSLVNIQITVLERVVALPGPSPKQKSTKKLNSLSSRYVRKTLSWLIIKTWKWELPVHLWEKYLKTKKRWTELRCIFQPISSLRRQMDQWKKQKQLETTRSLVQETPLLLVFMLSPKSKNPDIFRKRISIERKES